MALYLVFHQYDDGRAVSLGSYGCDSADKAVDMALDRTFPKPPRDSLRAFTFFSALDAYRYHVVTFIGINDQGLPANVNSGPIYLSDDLEHAREGMMALAARSYGCTGAMIFDRDMLMIDHYRRV
jgi:hypothetical protein